MADVVSLDRHVLASPATAFDTAWSTYGWTPGIQDRVGRLEEEVPWGTHVARATDPPRLSGPAQALLNPDNLDRLGSGVLRVDGRLGFALWGAFGSGSGGADRRVLTHTLLMDDAAFRQVAGYPQGLLWDGDRPAAWFRELAEEQDFLEPTPLTPVRLGLERARTAALARARIVELDRLRGAVLDQLGGDVDGLSSLLATTYEAVARASAGDQVRHVVVRGVGAATSRLLKLVWLSLPLEDRIRVSYVTEQRRSERPRGLLLGLPEAEWGRYVPDGSWVVDEHEPAEAGAGRVHWARALTAPDSLETFRRLDARAASRRWRLVTADDLAAEGARGAWQVAWASRGPTLDGVRALLELERRRPGGVRARALGQALGEAVATTTTERPGAVDAMDDALSLSTELPANARMGVLRGAVRALRARGPDGRRRAALLRCRAAASGDAELSSELHRLVDRESDALRALVADPERGGGLELVLGALPLAATGDPVGRELVRLGAAETRWTPARAATLGTALAARATDGDLDPILADILTTLLREGDHEGWHRLVSEVPASWLARPAILRELIGGIEAGRHPFGAGAPETGELADSLARRLLERAGRTGLGPERATAVLRLLWAAGSDEPLDALDLHASTRVPVLAELLAVPAPLPLFHGIRRRLERALDAAGADRSAEPWVDTLRPWAPALARRLAGNDSAAPHPAPRFLVGAGS